MCSWAKCAAFPDYEVSDEGEVRRATAGQGAVVGKLCRPYIDKDRRASVSIRVDGKTKTVRIATLVATAFVGPKPEGRYEVCHNDGNPQNNRKENLRWDTSAGNKADMLRHGTRLRGEKHHNAKLAPQNIEAIEKMWLSGMKQREIGKFFGVNQSAISKIINGKRWRQPS